MSELFKNYSNFVCLLYAIILVLFLGGHPSVTPKHLENVNVVVSGAAPIGNLDAERFIQK